MINSQSIIQFKKALYWGAFFMPVQNMFRIFVISLLLLTGCEAKSDYQYVKWVYDGDTLLLKDGRKIRLIGMNTPEVAHHKQKGQRYGREATETLRELLKGANNKVRLERGKKAKDRYKRDLAHVFLPDGTDISEWMLQQGWATLMVFPPNTRYINDYRKAERVAQLKKRRIWRQKTHQIQKPRQLKRAYRGYVRLKSTIKSIKITKNNIILELDQKIFIKLAKQNLNYFNHYDPKKLLHQEVIISGLLQKYRGKRIIRLRHPAQLTLVD
ncbi:MAG: thermonuclease family protein [Cocleimonas sp.]|nr:thermonuclease family protein [Cocleimonas sp.]